MGAISSSGRDNDGQRRSQRVMLNVSVKVLAQAANKLVSEKTRTVTVSAHGAMVLLSMEVAVGQMVTLRHLGTGDEMTCHVAYVSPFQLDKKEVGLDFAEPSPRFWRISFPPSDWTMRSPEAKTSGRGDGMREHSKAKK